MVKGTQIQYSLFEYLGDSLNAKFYRSMDSSLSEIIIIYRNKTKGTTDRFTNVNEFIDNYCINLKKDVKRYYKFDYALLHLKRGTKLQIRNWKQRIIYLIERRKDILVTLLSRKDFDSKEAVSETILSIHDWLSTLEKNEDIADWILNIQNIMPTLEIYKVIEGNPKTETISMESKISTIANNNNCPEIPKNSKSDARIETIDEKNKISIVPKYNFFWQLLNGKTDEEKKKLFDFIPLKLLDKYIIQESDTYYKWNNESSGKLKSLVGLIYVLTENKYLTVKVSPKDLAHLITHWLSHTCKASSLEKGLQPEELKIFTEKKKRKYTDDFFAYFPQKKI